MTFHFLCAIAEIGCLKSQSSQPSKHVDYAPANTAANIKVSKIKPPIRNAIDT